ncbi:DUF1016 N-terminal domain-containing protein [Flavobacterium phragmitis]|nr:DUF1016 N-terminal domain-containing protein [Flavobacterium phragmitis]
MPDGLQNKVIFQQVAELLQNARQQVLRTVNSTMTITYFEIGRIIVEEEQNGKDRAEYGKQLLKGLSQQLTKEFGKGFSIRNLKQIRQFYMTFSKSESLSRILQIQKAQTVSAKFDKVDYQTLFSFFKLTFSQFRPDADVYQLLR